MHKAEIEINKKALFHVMYFLGAKKIENFKLILIHYFNSCLKLFFVIFLFNYFAREKTL